MLMARVSIRMVKIWLKGYTYILRIEEYEIFKGILKGLEVAIKDVREENYDADTDDYLDDEELDIALYVIWETMSIIEYIETVVVHNADRNNENDLEDDIIMRGSSDFEELVIKYGVKKIVAVLGWIWHVFEKTIDEKFFLDLLAIAKDKRSRAMLGLSTRKGYSIEYIKGQGPTPRGNKKPPKGTK